MLTKTDLVEIGKLLDDRLEKKLNSKLSPLKDDIAEIRKDQKLIVSFFDKEYLDIRKRVEKIEAYLKLSSN